MTNGHWLEDPKAVREAERLYEFVGRYVITFQWLEGKVEEMILLARGHENREETFEWLARRTNYDKVKELVAIVAGEETFREIDVAGWQERFDDVIARLHAERRRRNGLLHAQYLFDFLTTGAPVMRTDIDRTDTGVQFKQDELSPERCNEILEEVAVLSLDLNMVCVQLIHAYPNETGGA